MSESYVSKQNLVFSLMGLLIGLGGLLIAYLDYAGKLDEQDTAFQNAIRETYRRESLNLERQLKEVEAFADELAERLKLWSLYRVERDLKPTQAMVKHLKGELTLTQELSQDRSDQRLHLIPDEPVKNLEIFSARLALISERRALLKRSLNRARRDHELNAYTEYHERWDRIASRMAPLICSDQVKMESPQEIYRYDSCQPSKSERAMITVDFPRGHFYGFLLESVSGEPALIKSLHYDTSTRLKMKIKPPQSRNMMLGIWSYQPRTEFSREMSLSELERWLAQHNAHPELCVVALPFHASPLDPQ